MVSGVEAFPSLPLPIFVFSSHPNVFTDCPKNGPVAGLYHEVFDTLIETTEEGEVIPVKPYMGPQSVGNGEIRGKEQHPEPNYVACRMVLHQVRYFENLSIMPPNIAVPADGEINHYK